MKTQATTKIGWKILGAIILLVIVLWAANLLFVLYHFGAPKGPGIFGDMFGAVNALFSGLAFAFVIFAIFLQRQEYILQLKELKMSAKAQANSLVFSALNTLSARWNSVPMFNARQKVAERFRNTGELEEGVWEIIAEFFEHLGACVHQDAISADFIWDTYGWYIENYWMIVKPMVCGLRDKDGDPSYYWRFEGLFEKMMALSRSQIGSEFTYSDSDISGFCDDEILLTKAGIDSFSSSHTC